ncbi:phosphotransferase [Brachybacterium sp. YJGR34]|uniref:phosphotransferase n=1 Tax=Brachybacterium sp. YJGR34 TaxID=2059911 RepID=UPI000E0B1FE1|nr:phosphotransferase [Brachybacterium sp. YJGR34]
MDNREDAAEHTLDGGNATAGVVRIGDTVRKPWEPTTPAVHEFMAHVAAAGVEVPAVLGRDDRGRQILEHVPGELALHSPPLTREDLIRVGGMLRAFHEASAGFVPSAPAPWEPLLPAPGGAAELICHGDLTPWNLILGERWVFIDWDGAGPSTLLWDLAYSAQAFTLNDASREPRAAAADLTALIEGYGADPGLRAQLPRAMAERTAAMLELLRSAHAAGREPWGTMHVQGHGEHWRRVGAYVAEHEALWTSALRA